jgi:hypothetical protein
MLICFRRKRETIVMTATRSISDENTTQSCPLAAFATRAIFLVALLAITHAAKGAGIEDGFYSSSDEPSAQAVTNQSGLEIRLGQKRLPKSLKPEFPRETTPILSF